jgi:hypothetical protein
MVIAIDVSWQPTDEFYKVCLNIIAGHCLLLKHEKMICTCRPNLMYLKYWTCFDKCIETKFKIKPFINAMNLILNWGIVLIELNMLNFSTCIWREMSWPVFLTTFSTAYRGWPGLTWGGTNCYDYPVSTRADIITSEHFCWKGTNYVVFLWN